MTRAEAIKWQRAGVALLEKFPERRGYHYFTGAKDKCRVCLAGAAAVASFEGRAYTRSEGIIRAEEIDLALSQQPSLINYRQSQYQWPFGPLTPALAAEMRAWLDEAEAAL